MNFDPFLNIDLLKKLMVISCSMHIFILELLKKFLKKLIFPRWTLFIISFSSFFAGVFMIWHFWFYLGRLWFVFLFFYVIKPKLICFVVGSHVAWAPEVPERTSRGRTETERSVHEDTGIHRQVTLFSFQGLKGNIF